MTSTTEKTMTIGEVSELTGLSTHTLRFYEQERLITPILRDASGRRAFTTENVEWLRVCTKLRASGMPLPAIRHYVELFAAGPDTVLDRFDILRRHEADVRSQIDDLQDALHVIRHKIALYERHLAAGTAYALWRNGPECAPAQDAISQT